jgi:hypothetical protein
VIPYHYDDDREGPVYGDIPLVFFVIEDGDDKYSLCAQSFDGSWMNTVPIPHEQTDEYDDESVLFLLVTYPDIKVEQLRSLVNSHTPLKEIVDRVSVARYTITDPHIRRVFCALTVGGS